MVNLRKLTSRLLTTTDFPLILRAKKFFFLYEKEIHLLFIIIMNKLISRRELHFHQLILYLYICLQMGMHTYMYEILST